MLFVAWCGAEHSRVFSTRPLCVPLFVERKAGGGGGCVIEGVPDAHLVAFLIIGPVIAIALVYLIMWIRSRVMKH